MADNVNVTSSGTTVVLADEIVHPNLGTGAVQLVKLVDGTNNGTTGAIIDTSGAMRISEGNKQSAATSMAEMLGVKTTTFTGTTRSPTGTDYQGVIIGLKLGAVTGTPTLSLAYDYSFDGVNFVRAGATGNATTANSSLSLLIHPMAINNVATGNGASAAPSILAPFWRISAIIGGTSPSFTIASCHFTYLK